MARFLSTISTIFPYPLKGPDAALVFCVCLLLMALMVLFMVLRIPRLLALLTSSDWHDGFVLRHVPASNRVHFPSFDLENEEFGTEPKGIYRPSASNRDPRRTRYPLHIPANIKFMRPLFKPFRARISPGFSFGRLVVLTIYFALLCFAATFNNSNILTNYSRSGWIATSQLPFIFVFAQKNCLVGTFLGSGYEKLNYLHRFVGKVVVLGSNLHAFRFFYKWSLEGALWKRMAKPVAIWGFVALVCMNSFYLFSIPFVREKAYNLFYRIHIIAVLLVLPALYLHDIVTTPYVLTCAALYTLDSVLRLIKTRFATAYIQPLTELDVTRVQIPHINAGWCAGQHVRLRVLSFQMGWLGWTETHPFTIANSSHGSPEGLTLLCKRTGDWTRKLFDAAKAGNKYGSRIKVLVEGPYGGAGHTIYSSFSAAVLIAGGSGISYTLSVIQDLVQKDLKKESRIRIADLVWIVQDPASVVSLLPKFSSLVQHSGQTQIRIHVYYTAALTKQSGSVIKSSLSTLVDSSRSQTHQGGPTGTLTADDLPQGISFSAGRPNLKNFFHDAIRRVSTLHLGGGERVRLTGMVVGVCGPVCMVDDVSTAVDAIDPIKRDRVGGVEICEEIFDW